MACYILESLNELIASRWIHPSELLVVSNAFYRHHLESTRDVTSLTRNGLYYSKSQVGDIMFPSQVQSVMSYHITVPGVLVILLKKK